MKYLKMLGLAAVAAMALTAFLGAGSASATVLCKTTTTPCGAEWHYPVGTVVDASLEAGSTLRLKNTSGTTIVTCTASTVKGETTNTGSSTETVHGNLSVLTFEGCDNTVHVVKLGKLEVHWIEGTHNGTLTASESEVTATVFGVSCGYTAGAGTHVGILTGGSMATGDFNAIVNKSNGGFLCPSTAVWEGVYTVTSPEPLYVTTN